MKIATSLSTSAILLVAITIFAADEAKAQSKSRGNAGGWAIGQEFKNGKFFRCTADTQGATNKGLRFSFIGLDRHLSIQGTGAGKGSSDNLDITLIPGNLKLSLPMTDLGDNRLWTARSLSNGDLDKIAKAKAAQFRLQSNGRV